MGMSFRQGAVKDGHAEMVPFGRPFIANPDLPARLRLNAPPAVASPETYYGGGARGYTDFATLDQQTSVL